MSIGHWTQLDSPNKALMNLSCWRGTRHCSQGIWEEPTKPYKRRKGRWNSNGRRLWIVQRDTESLLFWKNPQVLGRSMEEGVIWTVSINAWAWAIIYLLCPSNSSVIHCLKGRTSFCSGVAWVSCLDLGKRSRRYLKASLQNKPRVWMWPLLDVYTLMPPVHHLMPVFLQEPAHWWPLSHSFPY